MLRGLIVALVSGLAASGRHLLIVLDDLHLADSQSWATLGALARHLRASSSPPLRNVALLAAWRPPAPGSPAAAAMADLLEGRGRAACHRLTLGALSEARFPARAPRALRDFVASQVHIYLI
eukprot:tig00000042_g15620.t1